MTSRGPGTASLFALGLIRVLFGEAKEVEIGKGTLVYLPEVPKNRFLIA